MPLTFSVTWDYRCPFARNVHEHLLTGLDAGADWDVTFLPFSLGQVHVQEGEPSVWEKPEQDSGILALQAGVVVRDEYPDRFRDVHRALFTARHDDARRIDNPDIVADVLATQGVDAAAVMAMIDSGEALQRVRSEHERYAESHHVWGVPTFLVGEQAVFVRLMNRPTDAAQDSISAVERIVDLVGGWIDLNEFKHTAIPK